MKLSEAIENISSRRKHKFVTYFWLTMIPFALGVVTSSYCILSHGSEIGEQLMVAGMKVKSAGMTHVVEDLGYLDIDPQEISTTSRKSTK